MDLPLFICILIILGFGLHLLRESFVVDTTYVNTPNLKGVFLTRPYVSVPVPMPPMYIPYLTSPASRVGIPDTGRVYMGPSSFGGPMLTSIRTEPEGRWVIIGYGYRENDPNGRLINVYQLKYPDREIYTYGVRFRKDGVFAPFDTPVNERLRNGDRFVVPGKGAYRFVETRRNQFVWF